MSRITIFAGHYGSGKTNLAINYAARLRNRGETVTLADLDIVNPYFRTKDSAELLRRQGIRLVVSEYANSNVDFPAMPKELYGVVADRATRVVMDVGGDDRGALALGRYVDDIVAEGDYEMLAVVNASRPLTRTPVDTIDVLREIESAAHLRFTGIVNNTNLGPETTAAAVIASFPYAAEISRTMGIPVRYTCVESRLADRIAVPEGELLPLDLQRLYYQLT